MLLKEAKCYFLVSFVIEPSVLLQMLGFLDGPMSKELACSAEDTGDVGLIPGLGISPGGENGNPLQYSCLKNSMDRGAWQAI